MSDHITNADLLTHTIEGKDRLNKAKEVLREEIIAERHRNKNKETELAFDLSELKENAALHQQSQEFMNEKVGKIEEHVKDIKMLIEKQAETFATKHDHEQNKEANNDNKQEIKNIKESNKKALVWIIGFLVSIITSIAYIIISKNI